jgi:protein translocase SecG subunit
MKSSLIVALILIGIVFMISVLLMSPKGWLGFGIGGAGGSNEYGSKKSIEFTLKRVALIAGIAFVVVATAIPLISK